MGIQRLILLVLFCVTGCSQNTVSHNIADNAINQATVIEQSLPSNCATESIKTQIKGIKSEIIAIVNACETEKQVIEQEKIRWKWSFLGLALVVAAYIARRLII